MFLLQAKTQLQIIWLSRLPICTVALRNARSVEAFDLHFSIIIECIIVFTLSGLAMYLTAYPHQLPSDRPTLWNAFTSQRTHTNIKSSDVKKQTMYNVPDQECIIQPPTCQTQQRSEIIFFFNFSLLYSPSQPVDFFFFFSLSFLNIYFFPFVIFCILFLLHFFCLFFYLILEAGEFRPVY